MSDETENKLPENKESITNTEVTDFCGVDGSKIITVDGESFSIDDAKRYVESCIDALNKEREMSVSGNQKHSDPQEIAEKCDDIVDFLDAQEDEEEDEEDSGDDECLEDLSDHGHLSADSAWIGLDVPRSAVMVKDILNSFLSPGSITNDSELSKSRIESALIMQLGAIAVMNVIANQKVSFLPNFPEHDQIVVIVSFTEPRSGKNYEIQKLINWKDVPKAVEKSVRKNEVIFELYEKLIVNAEKDLKTASERRDRQVRILKQKLCVLQVLENAGIRIESRDDSISLMKDEPGGSYFTARFDYIVNGSADALYFVKDDGVGGMEVINVYETIMA